MSGTRSDPLRRLAAVLPCALVALHAHAQAFTDLAAFRSALTQGFASQDFDAFAHGATVPAALPGLRFLGRAPSIWAEQTHPSGGSWYTAPNVLLNAHPDPIAIVFEPPVHGAGLFNTSIADRERLDLCACDGTPLFSGELPQGSVNFLGFVSPVPIAFLRVTPIAPTNTTIFIDSLTFGFTAAPGSCRPPGPVTAACTMRNGGNANPAHYSCTQLPIVGATWQTRIALAPTGTTLLSAVLYSFGGPLATPVPCESLLPFCAGLEVLNGGPYHPVIDLDHVYDVPVPCAVDLLGTTVVSQGLRFERRGGADWLVPLNALDATVGF